MVKNHLNEQIESMKYTITKLEQQEDPFAFKMHGNVLLKEEKSVVIAAVKEKLEQFTKRRDDLEQKIKDMAVSGSAE